SPVSALRGELIRGKGASALRSVLIVVQFTIAIGLIVGGYTVKNQIDYALSASLGFDPQNVVTIELPEANATQVHALMNTALSSLAGVASVSAGTGIPGRSLSDGGGFVPENGDTDAMLVTRVVSVSDGYFDALGMDVLAGRALSEDFATDMKPPLSAERTLAAGGMMLNATAARLAGWSDPGQAVGHHFFQGYEVDGARWLNDYTVVGVV